MPKIYIEINQNIDFNIEIYNDPISQLFFQQHVECSQKQPEFTDAIIDDCTRYTISYFIDLVERAHQTNTINWTNYTILPGKEHYASNQRNFNLMHKDLEVVAGLQAYSGLNETQKMLVDEMHCCLHTLESDSAPLDYKFDGRFWLNFQYRFNVPDKQPMPEPVKFKRRLEPGEVMLDYPYVGKEPIFCMIHKDDSILTQTCKMIDRISVTWKLHLAERPATQWGWDPWPKDIDAELTDWYYEHEADMQALDYSLEKIINHTGFCPVGRIDDLSKMKYLRTTPNLQITKYELRD